MWSLPGQDEIIYTIKNHVLDAIHASNSGPRLVHRLVVFLMYIPRGERHQEEITRWVQSLEMSHTKYKKNLR